MDTASASPVLIDPDQLYDLDEFEALAIERLQPGARGMIQDGAGGGGVIRANRAAWNQYVLRPKALADVSRCEPGVTLLGERISMPILIAPSGLHGVAHPDAEYATACAARTADTIMVLSMGTSLTIEEVARAGARFWFQCYWGENRARLCELIRTAEAAGCKALCLTVDLPTRPWLSTRMRQALQQIGTIKPAYMEPRTVHTDPTRAWEHDARLTWHDLAWLRAQTALPLVLKGILTGEDAARAVDCGVSAIIVSNHGGRTSEDVAATADVLPEIVAAVGGRIPVLVDGGIRRGGDVVKAIALGADAVLVGRPVLWGLAVAGFPGAHRVLEILRGQMISTMGFIGARDVAAIERDRVRRRS